MQNYRFLYRFLLIALIATMGFATMARAAFEEKSASLALLPSHDFSLPPVGKQKMRAFLISGAYTFMAEEETMGFQPYLFGGLALESATGGTGEALPVFRLGGGIAYRLGPQWNLSLDYQTGLTAPDTAFTGRSLEPVDLEALNMGMKLTF